MIVQLQVPDPTQRLQRWVCVCVAAKPFPVAKRGLWCLGLVMFQSPLMRVCRYM